VEKPEMAAAMRRVAPTPPTAAAARGLARPALRLDAAHHLRGDRLGAGHAYNALPQTATANVNCRIVPPPPPTRCAPSSRA
jgi:acetylornithine deacetylase/succinyl-diaminopimelate desuccinylase-like protein